MFQWLLVFIGVTDPSGMPYLFWSGIFGDITIFVAIGVWYWKHTCHDPGCWRIARHAHEHGKYQFCRKHHPEI